MVLLILQDRLEQVARPVVAKLDSQAACGQDGIRTIRDRRGGSRRPPPMQTPPAMSLGLMRTAAKSANIRVSRASLGKEGPGPAAAAGKH